MKYRLRILLRCRPILRFVKFRILHINDSPQRIARGVATGFFVAYMPFFGLHMLIAFVLSHLLRANKALALMTVWISNPLTFILIYYPCYRLGHIVLPYFNNKPEVEIEQVEEMIGQTFSLGYMFSHLFTAAYWQQVWTVFTKIGLETFIGGIIIGVVLAKIGYWISYYCILGYRSRRQTRQRV